MSDDIQTYVPSDVEVATVDPNGVTVDACEHDWRVDAPLVLTSNPARACLVCAKCGATSSTVISDAWHAAGGDKKCL